MKNYTMTIKTAAEDAIQALKKIESHLTGKRDESVDVHFEESVVISPEIAEEKKECCGHCNCEEKTPEPAPEQAVPVRQPVGRPAIGNVVTTNTFSNPFAGTSWGV